jgi:PAS domain S-box-containing protein
MAGSPTASPSADSRNILPASVVSDPDELGSLLDLTLHATAATGAAFLIPTENHLRVLETRGANAPALDALIPLEGTVAGEAWYRGRLITGPEAPPRGRQAALWQDDRTIDVMAAPITVDGRAVAVLVLFHRHLGHFRRGDATGLSRVAAIAARLWSGASAAPAVEARTMMEVRATARLALLAAGRLDEADRWSEVVRTAAAMLEAKSARISLLEGNDLTCVAGSGRFQGDVGRRRARDFGFEGVTLDSLEGVLAADWTPEAGPGSASAWIRSLVSVPLRRLEQVIGVVTVADDTPGRFTETDREALLRFAIHATAALTEARLAASVEAHVAESQLATQVASALAAAEDTPALRRAIVAELTRALNASGARLSEVVQRHLAVTAVEGELPLLHRPPEPGSRLLCGHDLDSSGTTTHRCVLPGGEGYLLAAALGQVTAHPGCLQVVRTDFPFDVHQEDLLRRLTEIVELALLSRLSHVRLSQYADRIRSVAEVSATLHQSLRPFDAMVQAAEMLRRALGVKTVRVGLVDEVWQELSFPVYRVGDELQDGLRRPLARGLLEEVWRSGRTQFLPSNATEESAALGLTLDRMARCIAAVPLRTRGTITGFIAIEDDHQDHAFEAEDVRILEIVAQQLGVTLENLESLEEERRQRITAEWLRQMARTATDPAARPMQVFELAADAAYQGIGGISTGVTFLPGDGSRLQVAARGPDVQLVSDSFPVAGSVAAWMQEELGAVFISARLDRDPRIAPDPLRPNSAISLAAVPVWSDNRIVAVLELARPPGISFAVAEVERLAQIADHAGAGYQTAKAGAALRESEERYRRLFSAATDAIVTLDRQGLVTSFNEAAEGLWNVRAAEVVGYRWDRVLSFESPAMVAEQLARALTGESVSFEAWIRRHDAERCIVAMSFSPLVEDGSTTAVLGIVRDVSEQRRVQSQLLQAEKMSAIGQLVGGMAHEINNPLASILVNMELLLSEARDPSQLETLTAIKTETDRAAQIVRNLLTYVRGQGSARTVLDLRDAVRGAVALRRNQLLSSQISVEVHLPAEPVLVSGNKVNLQQVLMNLLMNAEQAIRSHRGRGSLWVRLVINEGLGVITVDDDGPGIPPEMLSRIFDPFYTTKPEGEGTGLGLSVSAGIVADHSGRISAAERPGGGARFTVELPLHSGGQRLAPEEPVRAILAPSEAAQRGRILLLDDEPDIRRSVSRFLIKTGWQVDLADSGEEGLRLLGQGEYAVVLCDLRMPGMSGHEFYRRLQAQGSAAVQRLVFMTGDVLSPEASRFLQEAARPVLSKPFTLNDLTEVLGQVVPG